MGSLPYRRNTFCSSSVSDWQMHSRLAGSPEGTWKHTHADVNLVALGGDHCVGVVIGLAVKYRYEAHKRKGTGLICASGRMCRK